MKELSTKPYLLRAIFEWCADSGLTPYLAVKVDGNTRVPAEFVKNGEIVLNISHGATRNLVMGNEFITFTARFNGVARDVSVPIEAASGIFARETGQGMAFPTQPAPEGAAASGQPPEPQPSPGGGKPRLQIIK